MTETHVEEGVPRFAVAFALLEDLVGSEVQPDEPLSTSAVESMDIVEWMIRIEEELGCDIAGAAESGLETLDFEATPRDVYNWFFPGGDRPQP